MRDVLKKGRCTCGSKAFEDVDATPEGMDKKCYFTRCKKCGFVIYTYRCGTNRGIARLVKLAVQMASGI